MILNSLKLKNFGIVKEANLEFKRGWNLISGPTGQGKSTVLKSLAYLLVGYTPKTIEDFLNWDSEDFIARLQFEHEGIPFDCKAEYFKSGNKSERELHVGGDKPYYASDVTKKMAEYFDPALCRAAILSFQNESDLVTLDPAKRRDLLKKIYDLNFENQINLLKEEIDEIDKKVKDIDYNVTVARTRISGYKIEELLKLPFEELDYRLKQDLLQKLYEEVAGVEGAIKEYDRIKKEIADKQVVIFKNRADRKVTEATILQCNNQVEQYKNTLTADSFYGKRNKLQADLNQDFEISKRDMEDQLSKIVLERIPRFDEEDFQKKQDRANELIRQGNNLKEKIAKCKAGLCPICGKEYNADEMEDDENTLIALRAGYEIVNKDIKALKELKISIDTQKEEQTKLIHQKEILQSKIENEIKMIAQKKLSIQKQLEAEEKNIVQMKEAIKLRIEIESEKLKAAIAKQAGIDSAIEEKEMEIRALQVSLPENRPEVNEDVRIQISSIDEELNEYKAVVVKNDQIVIRNFLSEKNKKVDEEKLDKLLKSKTSLLEDSENKKTAQTIYKTSFPNFIINDMISDIQDGANIFLDKAYDGRYHIQIGEFKNGLGITYGPKNKDIATVASGGEVDLFNVALKVSFSKIAGMKLLILDEIDKYFDDSVANHTFEILNDMLRANEFDQIFVVSHKEEVKDTLETQFSAKVFEFKKGEIF